MTRVNWRMWAGVLSTCSLAACVQTSLVELDPLSCEQDSDCLLQHCLPEGQCLAPDGDADDDGLINAREVEFGSDPFNPDSDGDGRSDLVEFGSAATPRDSDGDGLWDMLESAIDDKDQDCLADQIDAHDDAVASSAELLTAFPEACLTKGVCADGGVVASCRQNAGQAGTIHCDYSGVPNWSAEPLCEQELDANCDGEPDNDSTACLDDDQDGIPNHLDNCDQVANDDQEDLDGDKVGDHCDQPLPPEDVAISSLSGLTRPDQSVRVTGLAQRGHRVELHTTEDCSGMALAYVVTSTSSASEESPFELAFSLPEGLHTLAIQVKNNALGECTVLTREFRVTDERLPELTLNSARLQHWDTTSPSGITRASFAWPFTQSASSSETSLVVFNSENCQGTPSRVDFEEGAPAGFAWANLPISQANPALSGYIQDSRGVRSECQAWGQGYGRLTLKSTIAAPMEQALPGAKAWVVNPSTGEALSVHPLSTLQTLDLPLGAGLMVESARGQSAYSGIPSDTRPVLYAFWDLGPQVVPLEVAEAQTYALRLSPPLVVTNTSADRFWAWGPCGLSGSPFASSNERVFPLSQGCIKAGQSGEVTAFYAPATLPLGSLEHSETRRLRVRTDPGTYGDGSWKPDSTALSDDWTPSAELVLSPRAQVFTVAREGLDHLHSNSLQALAWPLGGWFSQAAYTSFNNANSTWDFFMLKALGDAGLVAGFSHIDPSSKVERIYARHTQTSTSRFNFREAELFPELPSDLQILKGERAHDWSVSVQSTGLSHVGRGRFILQGFAAAGHSQLTWEQTWSLDQGELPHPEALPYSEWVPLNIPWESTTGQVELLGFSRPLSWSQLLTQRRLNAESESFILSEVANSLSWVPLQLIRAHSR